MLLKQLLEKNVHKERRREIKKIRKEKTNGIDNKNKSKKEKEQKRNYTKNCFFEQKHH